MAFQRSSTDMRRGSRFALILPLALVFATAAKADFIDTTWSVVGFSGEPWFVSTTDVIGRSQTFNRGFAEGVFFNCDFAGMSSTYTTYEPDDFFANPEFVLFEAVEDGMRLSTSKIYVHRITCEGNGDHLHRQVLYPFVTNDARKSAWYLFEGGVFSLFAP
jgi:hypothetical protein